VSHFFGCTPLGPVGWGIALGSAAVATLGTRLVRDPVPPATPDSSDG
jgi:hypothetical protein